MKICHYLPSLNLNDGGPPRSVSHLCSELVENDFLITIITSHQNGSPEISLNPKINRLNIVENKELNLFIKSENFDVAHQHGIWLPSSHRFTTAVKNCKIPLVLSPRGMLQNWARNHKRLKKFVAWNAYQKNDLKKVDYFHATSLDESDNIKALGFDQTIKIIPNGVREPKIQFAKDFSRGKRNLVYLSRINQKKGLDLLLEAWAKTNAPNWNLLIAGNDDDNSLPKLINRSKQPDLNGRVQFLGEFDEERKAEIYKKADLFILPSYSENFGIVVAEALSFGVPVITTKGCPWQQLEEYKCGWWISLSVVNLIKAITKAINLSDEERTIMGRNGKRLIKNKYTWDKIVEEFIEFYNNI